VRHHQLLRSHVTKPRHDVNHDQTIVNTLFIRGITCSVELFVDIVNIVLSVYVMQEIAKLVYAC
jgi:hypothetical protein